MEDTVAVKVAGALKGVVRMSSYDATVGELRAEVGRLAGVCDPTAIKMIAGGRNLQDDSKALRDYNITANSRVLITKGAAAQAALSEQAARVSSEEARAAHLDRLKATLDKMASRDGRGLTDKWEFSLENQAGTRLALSDSDRRALVMGLALHEKGKESLGAGDLQAALGELLLAEESFSVVTPAVLEGIDNLAMLLLDIVWCCYKLRDISRLGVCSDRLASTRKMLERAHGAHQERLRLLHGNFSPEQAIYVRLELLEGVVCYHTGELAAAEQHLQAAQHRWQKLQLPEQALLSLAEMGYTDKESSRALRFSGGDLTAAVDFLMEQRRLQLERKQERKKQRSWNSERVTYGKTSAGKYVDMESLEQMCQLGYDRSLAAEALRQAENSSQSALDVLADPVRRGALQLAMVALQMLEADHGPQDVKLSHVQQLVGMGYKEKAARIALKASRDKVQLAVEKLQELGEEARAAAPPETAGAAGPSSAAEARPAAAAAVAPVERRHSRGRENDGEATQVDNPDGDSSASGSEADEIEAELVHTVAARDKEDPLSAYDIDVSEDGEAIQLYLSMLQSAKAQPG